MTARGKCKAPPAARRLLRCTAAAWIARVALALFGMSPFAVSIGGCGLGYIELVPEEYVGIRIENGSPESAEVTVAVQMSASTSGDQIAGEDASRSVADTVIRVASGNTARGEVLCGEILTIRAANGGFGAAAVELTGAGTGALGFDSGTTGLNGERYLQIGTHFQCDDTITIQLYGTSGGQISIVGPGVAPPDTVDPPSGDVETPEGDIQNEGLGDAARVTFRIENATATATDVGITPETGQESAESDTLGTVRVPPGHFSTGQIACGQTYVIIAAMASDSSAVLLTGDGTGTMGFDSSSIGLSGERLLVFGDHYACGETVVVRITDDGSGIGLSASEMPLGEVNVFATTESVPEPDLPDPDDLLDESPLIGQVTLVIANTVESTVQVNFATGSGSLTSTGGVDVSSEFDVRVPSGGTSTGSAVCAQGFIIAGAHLEATGTTVSSTSGGGSLFAGGGNVNFHGVVLTGDGTGTEGFDSSSIAVTRGRLLQLGTHFECGDTITVTITATNNRIKTDEEGSIVVDEFGDPTIQYGVGLGSVVVTPGS